MRGFLLLENSVCFYRGNIVIYIYIYKREAFLLAEKKTKKVLTKEEKKKKLKEELESWFFCLFFVIIFIAAFAFYGMKSALFGG